MTKDSKKVWRKVFDDSRYCERCGGGKRNPSNLCSECNNKWDRYMREHPLLNYDDLVAMEKESNQRWRDFIHDKD